MGLSQISLSPFIKHIEEKRYLKLSNLSINGVVAIPYSWSKAAEGKKGIITIGSRIENIAFDSNDVEEGGVNAIKNVKSIPIKDTDSILTVTTDSNDAVLKVYGADILTYSTP